MSEQNLNDTQDVNDSISVSSSHSEPLNFNKHNTVDIDAITTKAGYSTTETNWDTIEPMTELTISTTPSTLLTRPNNVNETKQNSLFNTAFNKFLGVLTIFSLCVPLFLFDVVLGGIYFILITVLFFVCTSKDENDTKHVSEKNLLNKHIELLDLNLETLEEKCKKVDGNYTHIIEKLINIQSDKKQLLKDIDTYYSIKEKNNKVTMKPYIDKINTWNNELSEHLNTINNELAKQLLQK
jgi:hypothetical protein